MCTPLFNRIVQYVQPVRQIRMLHLLFTTNWQIPFGKMPITLTWPIQLLLQNTPTASLQRGKSPPTSVLHMILKQSDGEAPLMLELKKMWSTPLLLPLSRPLWSRVESTWFGPIYESNRSVCHLNCTHAKLNCLNLFYTLPMNINGYIPFFILLYTLPMNINGQVPLINMLDIIERGEFILFSCHH